MNIARRVTKRIFREIQKRKYNLVYIKPGYWIRNSLSSGGIVVDCGLGDTADFSQYLIQRYGVRCYGFEPTRKHYYLLDEIADKYGNLFQYHSFAITGETGKITFFESQKNISGSILDDHVNIKRDEIVSYEVQTITLDGVYDYLKVRFIDLMKLDIEGAEYAVLSTVQDASLKKIDQLVVEFHHYCVDQYSEQDTLDIVSRLKSTGFKAYTQDRKVYLFFS